jgi:gliding motility-associated-like protein
MRCCIFTLCFLIIGWLGTGWLAGQALPPLQPEQDCINALPVCQNVYTQTNSYTGEGMIPGEINQITSCLASGEENDVWYIFTVQTAGDVCFTLTPTNGTDDYDWAVYDLTNNGCSDIFSNPNLEVSCNYSGATGCGAITGPNGNPNCPLQNNPCIPVQVGETYVVNVSNFSGSASGYTLDFTASSATIFDNVPPAIDSLAISCEGEMLVFFSENVVCSSVDINDFTITSLVNGVTIPVSAISSDACAIGATFDNDFVLTLGSFPVPGPVSVLISGTVLDNCGNAAIFALGDTVLWAPQVGPLVVTLSDDSICTGESVTLTMPQTLGDTYSWSVPGADTFVVVSPLVTTTYIGYSTNAFGCERSDTVTVVVSPTPTSAFTATPQVCVDSLADVVFQGSAGPTAVYTWDFGPGIIQSGAGAGPYEVSFGTGAIYPLSLSVDDQGCLSDTTVVNVVVPPKPIAALDLDATSCLGDTFDVDLLTPASGTAIYTWDFDGAVVLSGTGAGPYQVEWLTPGPKQICLTVEESGCFSDPICANVQVNVPPGGSIFPVDPQCLSGNEFTFFYQGSPTIQAYQWQLGEAGQSSNDVDPVIQYDSAGVKTITVVVTGINGCVNTDTLAAEVFPMPVADFVADTVCAGATTNLQDQSSSAPAFPIDGYAWDLGDGSTSDQLNPQHLFPGAGSYQVQLMVTTAQGCQDSITRSVPIRANPVADFTFGPFCVDQSAPLTNTSSVPNLPASYRWQFPDGNESEAFEPFFASDTRGDKPVTLTATNGFGCTDDVSDTVKVFGLPAADFDSDLTCDGTDMLLRSTVETEPGDSIARYEWILGDGSQAEGMEISHLYSRAGRYLVTHKVETTLGCRDSVADSVIVWANPQAEFTQRQACVDEVATFESTSLPAYLFGGALQSWNWTFGDGGIGSGVSTSHTYVEADDYLVRLIVQTDRGCADTLTRLVPAYPRPEPPTTETDSICAGTFATLRSDEPQFTDRVLWYDAPTNGNLVGSDTLFRTALLTATTTFYAVAESDRGCRSEATPAVVIVAPTPAGEILASERTVEMPEAFVAFALSGNFAGRDYEWDFDDGETSTEADPTHDFQAAGRRLVRVEVITEEGCFIRLETEITVIRPFNLSIPSAFSPNRDGVNDFFYIGSYQVATFEFMVYNRWGQVVFSTDQPDFQWDGTSDRGGVLPSGNYVYRAAGTDTHGRDFDFTGTITMLR